LIFSFGKRTSGKKIPKTLVKEPCEGRTEKKDRGEKVPEKRDSHRGRGEKRRKKGFWKVKQGKVRRRRENWKARKRGQERKRERIWAKKNGGGGVSKGDKQPAASHVGEKKGNQGGWVGRRVGGKKEAGGMDMDQTREGERLKRRKEILGIDHQVELIPGTPHMKRGKVKFKGRRAIRSPKRSNGGGRGVGGKRGS